MALAPCLRFGLRFDVSVCNHPRRGLLCGAGLSFFCALLLRRALGGTRLLALVARLRRTFAAAGRFLGVAGGRAAVALLRAVALAFRLRRRVQIRVPAAALQLKGGLADEALALLLLALRTRPDGRVRHLLPFLELVAACGARVFIDGHSAPWARLWRANLRHERKAVKRTPRVPEEFRFYEP